MYIFSRSVKNKHLEKFDLSGLYLQIVSSSFAENGTFEPLHYSTFSAEYSTKTPKSESLCMHSQVILAQPNQFPLT